jgi:hypothetical protein
MKEQGLWGHFDDLIEELQHITSGKAFSLYTKVQQASNSIFLQSVMESPKVFFPSSGDVIQHSADVNEEVKKLLRLPYPTTVILTDIPPYDRVVVVAYDLDALCDENGSNSPFSKHGDGGIGFSVAVNYKATHGGNRWSLIPVLCALHPKDAGSCGIQVRVVEDDVISKLTQAHSHDTTLGKEELVKQLRVLAGRLGAMAIVNTCVLLNTHNTTQETIEAPKALNQKRAKKGKRPLLDYKILVVDGERWDSNDAARAMVQGDGSGVRSHLRRGHIRHLASGKIAYVRATYVHGSKEGFIKKDYSIGGSHAIRQQA